MDSLEIERTHQYQVFDGSLDSIFVLRSVREDSCLVQNFVIDYANQRAIDVGGRPITTLVGRLFTDAYPEAVEMGLWTFFGRSLNPASPTRTTTSTTALRSTAFTPRDGSICKLRSLRVPSSSLSETSRANGNVTANGPMSERRQWQSNERSFRTNCQSSPDSR